MTRQQRRAINRANAQLSTGPVTDQGKAASSTNATKHGLTSMKPCLPFEQQDYDAFAADNLRRLDPQNHVEQTLVETIINTEWRLKRIPALEARLFAASDDDDDPHKTIRSLATLSRHEVRLRKLLTNTLMELHNIVAMRRKHQQQQALVTQQKEDGFVLKSPQTAQPRTFVDQLAESQAIVDAEDAAIAAAKAARKTRGTIAA